MPPILLFKLSETEVDMIVIGMTGEKGGLLDELLGRVSSHVSQKAKCPVLFVPTSWKFKEIKNIMYTSRYAEENEGLLQHVYDFGTPFKAQVHIIHVKTSRNKDVQFPDKNLLLAFHKEKAPLLSFRIRNFQGKTVCSGITDYVKSYNIDLLFMVTHQRSFWGNLFHKSTTKQVVENASFPIMFIHLEE